MHLLLITKHNQLLEGILLAAGHGTIRVAARGCNDTLELKRVDESRWMSNTGRTFEIASISACSENDAATVERALLPPVARAAGGASSAHWN
jgi:hypothetical protein